MFSIGILSRSFGFLLIFLGCILIFPIAISLFYQDGHHLAFIDASLMLILSGIFLAYAFRKHKKDPLNVRGVFLLSVGFWLFFSLEAALVFYFVLDTSVYSFVDCLFEATSALTSTGSTILKDIENLPRSILFFRLFLQWLGGMGIILLAVVILPTFKTGSVQLFKTEMSSMVHNKLTPRIKDTAAILWSLYLLLTICCALGYYLAGMSAFDAITHAFSTISLGGLSNYDASLAHFHNPRIEWVAIFFMFVAGINFVVHYYAFFAGKKQLWLYFKDPEIRYFVLFLGIGFGLSALLLHLHHFTEWNWDNTRQNLFMVLSLMTTTGYVVEGFGEWSHNIPLLLLCGSFIGACTGSTTGGLKSLRIAILLKKFYGELQQIVHPKAVFALRVGEKNIVSSQLQSVWSFFAIYLVIYALLVVVLLAFGHDATSALGSAMAALNNAGASVGDSASGFYHYHSIEKLLLSLAMIMGRLEIFTLLVICIPEFWRK